MCMFQIIILRNYEIGKRVGYKNKIIISMKSLKPYAHLIKFEILLLNKVCNQVQSIEDANCIKVAIPVLKNVTIDEIVKDRTN